MRLPRPARPAIQRNSHREGGSLPMTRPAIVIPFYNHEIALPATVAALREAGLRCWVVDDGSDPRCDAVLAALEREHRAWVTVLRLSPNCGKGHAVIAGLRAALAAGCTHGVQIDADGQHDVRDLPALLAASAAQPDAVVTGVPVYDDSVPKIRFYGRYLTHIIVWINTLSLQIRDSMCGFRVYPLRSTLAVWDAGGVGGRMEFDTGILVRMYWHGVSVVNIPTRVTYPADGVSHFDLLHDNLRIAAMHVRMFFGMLKRLPVLLMRPRTPRAVAGHGIHQSSLDEL
jgi:glycosyltransferase involved in cell wall biosynthesis